MIAKQALEQVEKGSLIRKMFEEGNRLAAIYGSDRVYDFSLGNPDLAPPPELLIALEKNAGDPAVGAHAYMPNAGYSSSRQKIAEYEGKRNHLPIPAESITFTVGAAGAINVALHALCDPGDEVIVLAPYFPEYFHYIRSAGGVMKPVPTRADFQLDIEAIRKEIGPNTKAILLNSPNNPTGVVYPEKDLQALNDLLLEQKQTIYVICDEPYREINYSGQDTPPVLQIITNGMIAYSWSKYYAIPGERIGYLCVSPACDDFENLCAALSFYNRTLGFVNAPAIWQKTVASCLELKVDMSSYLARRQTMWEILNDLGISCVFPQGAFYLFPQVPEGLSDLEFADLCAQNRILLVPGSGFGLPGHVRISYAVPEEKILASREQFAKVMADIKA